MQYPVIFLITNLQILITYKFRRFFFYSGKQDATGALAQTGGMHKA